MRLAWVSLLQLGLVWFSLSAVPVAGRAGEPAKLAVTQQAPPAEVAEEIRSVLRSAVVRIAQGDQPLVEFWFRQEIPLAKKPTGDAFAITAVKEGTLLGAIKVHEERYDFKDEEIPPGVYTLRLGLQPVDGDHLGTSPTETFALLIPAEDDRKLQAFRGHDELVKASSTINAAEHPSNLNLQPVAESGDDFPRLGSQHEGRHKVVCLRLPAKVEGETDLLMVSFALVYEGKGET
jgi:hypothetical protein